MNFSPQANSHIGQLQKSGVFRAELSTLVQQAVAGEVDPEETQKIIPVDPEETQKLPILRIERREKPPVTIRAFPAQAVTDGVKLPITSPPSNAGVRKTKKQKWVGLAIRLGITLLLFALLFKSVSWTTVLATLEHVNLGLILIGVTVGAYGNVVSSYQWRSLLHSERIRFDFARLINLYLVGIAFSHFLPTGMGGDAVKAYYVGRDSANSGGSASAVVMSRITGFFGMLLTALPVLLIWHEHFTSEVLILFAILSLSVGCMIGVAVFTATRLPKILKKSWAKYRLFAVVIEIGNALSNRTRQPRSLLIPTLFGVLFWVIASLNYYSYALALGIHAPLYFYLVAIPLVSLVAFLPISLNGFGVRESALVFVFSTIHVPAVTSLLLALLMDVQVLLFGAIGGCMYLAMDRKARDSKAELGLGAYVVAERSGADRASGVGE